MDTHEFSNSFDVLLNSYALAAGYGEDAAKALITLDEYEKSVFLTKAQTEVVVNLYNGKNVYGDSFESTEEVRRYLDSLIKEYSYEIGNSEPAKWAVSNNVILTLPPDVAFITLEVAKYGGEEENCFYRKTCSVVPITHDEYNQVKNNPFRGPTDYKALRLDYGENKVMILSKHPLANYYIKYLAKPTPIVLADFPENVTIEGEHNRTECKLTPLLHQTILDRAVVLAATSKSIGKATPKEEDKS